MTSSRLIDRIQCRLFGHETEKYMPDPGLAKERCTRCGGSIVNWDARPYREGLEP